MPDRRMLALLACGAVAAAAVALPFALDRVRGAELAGPAERWDTTAVADGMAARVAGPDGTGKNCFHYETAVAASASSVWVSQVCVTGPGDETAPQPDPAHAVDVLKPDGSVQRLPPADDREAPLTVEDIASDGTIWALQNGRVLKATPGGSFVPLEAFGSDQMRTTDDIVDLDVTDDGTVYVAAGHSVVALSPSGATRLVAGALEGGSTGQTDYADQAVPDPRPAVGEPLPTVTGVTAMPDGTVIVLAVDTVLAVDPAGGMRTLISPATAGDDPATRLRRARVRDGGSGAYLADAVPYGGDVLIYDQTGGRILRLTKQGKLTHLAGGTADENGFSALGPGGHRTQWGPDADRRLPVDTVRLAAGGTLRRAVRLAVMDDGQVLAVAGGQGVVRLGLRP